MDFSGVTGDPGALAKTASAAYDAALEVIASVEPRVAEATRKELADQQLTRLNFVRFSHCLQLVVDHVDDSVGHPICYRPILFHSSP